MKRFIRISAASAAMLFLLIALGTTSCTKEQPAAEQAEAQLIESPMDDLRAAVEAGTPVKGKLIQTFQPEMIDVQATDPATVSGKTGSCNFGDCCCRCTATISFDAVQAFTSPNDPIPWALEVIATCSDDPESIFGPDALQVGNFDWINNPIGSSATFPVLDEHYYWLVPNIGNPLFANGVLDVTINDAVGQYSLALPDVDIFAFPINILGLRLHCDAVSYSNCWDGGTRFCCL